jgi:signal transduction histidine kinase/Fe-S-cluster-containing hydrogenase component 2
MDQAVNIPLVSTIKERCRVCYTCVRECPAKAIRIAGGQAEVLPERCIGCGNCVRVCSQQAKRVRSSIPEVNQLLSSGAPVAACLAPSFPAEFFEFDYPELVGLVRSLGFTLVTEVAFGADLVAERYHALLVHSKSGRWIATNCPAKVEYVRRYHPALVPSLAPIVSPMVAQARALRRLHGSDLKVVFIGPCIAKKVEGDGPDGEIDAVLTFLELRQLLEDRGRRPGTAAPGEFDPPHAAMGALFPISRGMLQAANISEDLLTGEVVAADGRRNFVEAIKEFETGDLSVRLLEVLCCNGCIMGPGIGANLPLFKRRAKVSQYARRRLAALDQARWRKEVAGFADLDLSRTFSIEDRRIPLPSPGDITAILNRMGKFQPEDELNCGACGYDTCREHATAISRGLAENEMCLPYTIDQLRKTLQELAASHEQLASVQEALLQSEKLASMGQLAAGIAHEVNNPLGVVLMYAHILMEECEPQSRRREDLGMIAEQADRCKKIVAGLLNFARQNKVVRQPVDLTRLVERSLQTLPTPPHVTIRLEPQNYDPLAELDADQITQVLVNLIRNAYEAMPNGGALTIRTEGDERQVRLSVRDTGVGIPEENRSRIFTPFFTTKTLGKGTGLGLAVTYGIVKMHNGDIRVESNADPQAGPTGTTFTVTLPRQGFSNG